ncbi:hypothetical protein RFI_24447, partial [Reticulomyxa filosa]
MGSLCTCESIGKEKYGNNETYAEHHKYAIVKQDKTATAKADKEIDSVLGEYEREQQKISCRLMLLGAGESGKTTLLRQMRQKYAQPKKKKNKKKMDKISYATHFFFLKTNKKKPKRLRATKKNLTNLMTQNLIEAMRTLAVYSELLAEQGECTSVSKENEEIRNFVAALAEQEQFSPELCRDFKQLWEDVLFCLFFFFKINYFLQCSQFLYNKGIRRTFDLSHRFQLIDTADYLFANMDRYCQPQFLPTFDDLIHSQVFFCFLFFLCERISKRKKKKKKGTNSQLFYKLFTIKEKSDVITEYYEIYDVGGQKN